MPMDNKNANMEEKLRILEDLNMMYIRQIALSLQDSDIQKKMDHELRMREGACKLLLCCSQRDQALEAAKSLQTCSARILAYMSELQRMKEKQVLGRAARRSSESGPMDDRQPCNGKVAISDLRIPLMWKDTEYFKNKGELHRCAVFCLLQIGGEIFDTDMVMVDRTLTDICFDNTIVFSEAGPGFELRVELYSCCSEEEGAAGGGATPRKLASRLSSSLGRSAGKRLRGAMEPPGAGGGATLMLPVPAVPGPKYHLLAHTTLSLSHIQDSFRTHDLTISGHEECSYWLPLYGSVCCRLAAQPHCMTKQVMSGRLRVKQMGADSPGWTDVYGVLKGTNLFCYHRQEDVEANVEQAFTIAINKETRIRAWEKDAQSLCVSNQYGGEDVTHTLAAADAREDTHRWMEAFWQHFYDMSQWKQCCDDLMKIELPSPRKPALVTPKQGSLYHEMVIEASDDLSTVSDILARRMQELELRSQLGATPSWMSLFDPESPGRPPRPRTPSLAPHSPLGSPRHRRPPRSPLSPLRGPPLPRPSLLSSDASLTSDSDSPCSASPASSSSRHRRQAPPLSLPPPRHRPRTLSLDAKLSTLRGGRGYGGGALQTQCSCHQPPPSSSSSSSLLAPPAPPAPRAPPPPALSSCSSSTSSTSSSEGSHSPGSSEGGAPPFPPRPSPARRSLRNLRARLDPRNWLQSQV